MRLLSSFSRAWCIIAALGWKQLNPALSLHPGAGHLFIPHFYLLYFNTEKKLIFFFFVVSFHDTAR